MKTFKPFWQSKTIIISLISIIFMILDYSFNFGLVDATQDQLNKIFQTSADGDTIGGVNFLALAAFIYSIVMRFVSSNGITKDMKKAEKKNLGELHQNKLEIEKRIFQIPENFRPAILHHISRRVEEENEKLKQKLG